MSVSELLLAEHEDVRREMVRIRRAYATHGLALRSVIRKLLGPDATGEEVEAMVVSEVRAAYA